MSIPRLGLNDKQLAYLNFFGKDENGAIYKLKTDVFERQKQYLTECDTRIKDLEQRWETLFKDSQRFSVNFSELEEKQLRRVAANCDSWRTAKQSFDKTADNAARVYLPDGIAAKRRELGAHQIALENYLATTMLYLELCDIEHEIVTAYQSKARNYRAIEGAYDRYQKLPAEIREFVKEEPLRMMSELMKKVRILHDFDRAMEELGKHFAQFTQQVRSGTMTFTYASWNGVKKALADVPEWISAYKRFSDWVESLDKENQELLIGSNNATRTNNRNEYQTYAQAVLKMQRLLDESRVFYQACEVCSAIERLSRDLNRKKAEVGRVQRDYDALPAEAAKYVDSKIRSLLSAMMDSSDRLAQLESCIAGLELDFSKLPSDVKNGSPRYLYETFEELQNTMSRVELWKNDYGSMQRISKELNGKVMLSMALVQRINNMTAAWQKLTAATLAYDKMAKAYNYEFRLTSSAHEWKNDEKMASSFKAELEKMPRDAAALVSLRWKKALDWVLAMQAELRELRARAVALEREYAELDRRAVEPSYVTYSAACSVADKYGMAHRKLQTLIGDLTAHTQRYDDCEISLENIRAYDSKLDEYCDTVVRLKRCQGLYQWAHNYDEDSRKFSYDEMSDMLREFEMHQERYLEFDSQGFMTNVFDGISAMLRAVRVQAEREAAEKRRRARAKLITAVVFSSLIFVAEVVIGYVMTTIFGEGSFWLWLLAFICVGIGSVCLVKKCFKHKLLWIGMALLYSGYAVIYAVPMYFYEWGSDIWYMSYAVMAVIITTIFCIVNREKKLPTVFMGIYGTFSCLLSLGVIILRVAIRLEDAFFLDSGFFETIVNIVIAVWNIAVGLIVGVVNMLGLSIGAGFWMPYLFGDAELSAILNTVWYCVGVGYFGAMMCSKHAD